MTKSANSKTPLLALALAAAGSLLAMAHPAAAEVTKLASVTIITPDDVKILALSEGQPRLYDSNPLRVIEKVRADLAGAQFTAIPQRIINQYQIRVDASGVLYTFGGKSRTSPTRAEFLGENDSRWVQDNGAVEGKNLVACFRRTVAAGEIISVHGFELELAASSISTATTLTAPLRLAPVAANAAPSRQIEPLLEPCLDAILAPLEQNPYMPRVAVEKLQATLGAGLVTAKTAARQQAYQCAIAVCEALTSGMDERAQTRAAAEASGLLPSVSNGASIVKTSPLHGRDAGGAAEAIRRKQMDERNYADNHARALSNFMESSAYKAWVARSATLRENAMSLYAKLVQLESAEPFPETGAAGTTSPANPVPGDGQPLRAASTPVQTPDGQIQISSAIWQGPQPSQSIDVTQRIRELLDSGVTGVTVDSKALSAGRDPAPNETKRLIITYKVKGTEQTATWTEGHTLELNRFNGSGR
ncbi:MAG TPA: hypothetical protein VGM54_22825 [Chthoniobacter sp.]|jgi:hypothetical protein